MTREDDAYRRLTEPEWPRMPRVVLLLALIVGLTLGGAIGVVLQ